LVGPCAIAQRHLLDLDTDTRQPSLDLPLVHTAPPGCTTGRTIAAVRECCRRVRATVNAGDLRPDRPSLRDPPASRRLPLPTADEQR
jgi:hypothetical protein